MTNDAVEVFDGAVWTKWSYILLISHFIFSNLVRLESLAYCQGFVLLLLNQVTQFDLSELISLIDKSSVAFSRVVLFKVDVVRHAENLLNVELFLVNIDTRSFSRCRSRNFGW